MTSSFPVGVAPHVLMSFEDVLKGSFQEKQYEWAAQPSAPVSVHVLPLWRDRGYDPAETGGALVIFQEAGRASKPYSYPLYFWGEV